MPQSSIPVHDPRGRLVPDRLDLRCRIETALQKRADVPIDAPGSVTQHPSQIRVYQQLSDQLRVLRRYAGPLEKGDAQLSELIYRNTNGLNRRNVHGILPMSNVIQMILNFQFSIFNFQFHHWHMLLAWTCSSCLGNRKSTIAKRIDPHFI